MQYINPATMTEHALQPSKFNDVSSSKYTFTSENEKWREG